MVMGTVLPRSSFLMPDLAGEREGQSLSFPFGSQHKDFKDARRWGTNESWHSLSQVGQGRESPGSAGPI